MTYKEYMSAIQGATDGYTAVFETPEKRSAFIEALRAGGEAIRDLYACRNELCLHCGKYKSSHLGACRDCRWESVVSP